MIIFDLDGTLADCEHRRHFVDERKNLIFRQDDNNIDVRPGWKPDWKAFYEACDKDEPILQTHQVLRSLWSVHDYTTIEIWSGRCESVREKTEAWLMKYGILKGRLKMRPIGDYTPDDVLKERWLDEALAQGKKIDFVFDDRKKVCNMWRKRGIFVFDVNQTGEDF